MKKELQPCGTRAAYRRHRKNNEIPCDICINANAEDSLKRYHENPNSRKLSSSIWYYSNYSRARASKNNWKQNNLDKKNAFDLRSSHKRRAKILNNGFYPYKEEDVLTVYGAICHICSKEIDLSLPRKTSIPGWQMGLHIDHVVPISKGGPDTLENVRPAHGICNLKKHANTLSI